MTYKIFDTLQEYNDFTINGTHLTAGTLYLVKENKSLYFSTNNIDGEAEKYEYLDEIPEGYIKPEGNIIITENGEEIDISTYATASVDVPIPEGYIIPTGNKTITQNGENIDVAQYATASVNVEAPEKDYIVEGVEYDPTETYSGAFMSATQIVSADIPSGFTSIGSSAFYNCKKLTSITIPDSVTSIGESAFRKCTSLKTFTIPNTVTSIGNTMIDCDANSNSLSYIEFESTTPPSITGRSFSNMKDNIVFIVPSESLATYKAASNWSTLAYRILPSPNQSVQEMTMTTKVESGAYKYLKQVFGTYLNLRNKVKSLSIDGVVRDPIDWDEDITGEHTISIKFYDDRFIPQWYEYSAIDIKIRSVTLPSTTQIINSDAFQEQNIITSVTIPSGVTSMGNAVFRNCGSLTSITIQAATPPTLGANALVGTNANLTIYVPAESVC